MNTACYIFQSSNQPSEIKLDEPFHGKIYSLASEEKTLGSFFPLFTRFYTSQVVQDFFHQQYQQAKVLPFLGVRLVLWRLI